MTKKAFVFRPFAEKRDEWMRQLLREPVSELSPGAKTVALRLSLYMNEEKQRAFPSYDEIGRECGMSARMAQDHVNTLEGKRKGKTDDGKPRRGKQWLEIIRKRNSGNTYWLWFPWIE